MIPSFIILFREVLEMAVILSIIMAALKGVAGRGKFVLLGLAGGLVGSILVAVFAGQITNAMEGMGQEIFNGTILLVAATMIAWTTLWMQTHGRELSQKLRQVGASVRDGDLSLISVSAVVAISMWREGAEVALFMTGIIATSNEPIAAILGGALGGGLTAAAIGAAIYFGLITLSNRHLFKVTGVMLVLLAAGMAAAGAGYLAAADVLPALIQQVWDSSHILSENSLIGKILHAMFGYSERPSGIQLLFYVMTVVMIYTVIQIRQSRKPVIAYRAISGLVVVGVALTLVFLSAKSAYAAFTIDFL